MVKIDIDKIKKFLKDVNSRLENEEVKKWVLNFSYIGISFLILLIIFSLLNTVSKNFFSDTGISPSLFIVLFLMIFGVLSFLKFSLKNFPKIRKENLFVKNLFEKMNYWVIFTFSLVIVFIILSFFLYNSYTSYPLPLKGYVPIYGNQTSNDILQQNLEVPFFVDCHNERGERDYLLDKQVVCGLKIKYRSNYSSYLYKIEKIYFLKDGSQFPENLVMDKDQISNLIQKWNFGININSSFEHSLINFYFTNDSGTITQTNYMWVIPYRILSEEQYYEKREQSLLLFLTIISLALFSVVASIKNLKDIVK